MTESAAEVRGEAAPAWSGTAGGVIDARPEAARWISLPSSSAEFLRFAAVIAQVGFVWFICRALSIENSAFYNRILPLVFFGFILNHIISPAFRWQLFAGLSVASIPIVFGLVQGMWIIGISAGLIGLCYLPIAWRWRVLLVLAAGVVLALQRTNQIGSPWSSAIWPVLGSMFMFRMIIYLYDIKHLGRQSVAQTASYFFLLPNVVFPFFPVFDYHTFKRTHYERDAYDTYTEGVRWMLRGITHLVIYRLVYHYLIISPTDIQDTADLLRFVLANFMLYLRVSGIYHLVAGIVHLFGFHVPETHRFYFLPSSFTDIWRRINIYWKDFLQKTVYMPLYFRFRRSRGEKGALIIATAMVIVATWFYHSYQWFWLLGHGLWSATDAAFWVILGTALVINVVLEARQGRKRVVGGVTKPTHRQAMAVAFRTTIIMVPLAVLWALWTSPTFDVFVKIFSKGTFRLVDVVALVATVGGVFAIAYIAQRTAITAPQVKGPIAWYRNPLFTSAVPLAGIWALGLPSVSASLPDSIAQPLREVRVTELSRRDSQQMERGYYESLVGVSRFNPELWEVYSQAEVQEWKRLDEVGVSIRIDDAVHSELRPNQGVIFHGASLRTNRWGMRDKDYEKVPAPGTYRIAIMGASHILGSGVADDETFESVVESRLNRERVGNPAARYELLNFAVEAHTLTQQRITLERNRVWDFQPNAIAIMTHPMEYFLQARYIQQEVQRTEVPEDSLIREVVRQAGLTKDMDETEVQRRVRPFANQIIARELQLIADLVRKRNARLIYTLVPSPTWAPTRASGPFTLRTAGELGYEVLDISNVFEGRESKDLIVAQWDYHPNAKAHALIADRWYEELTKRPELLTPSAPATR